MKDINCISDGNRQRSQVFNIFKFVIIAMIIAVGGGLIGTQASVSAPVAKQAYTPIVSKCKADLAKRFKLQAQDITVIETQATTWGDAALGMPVIGKVYAQMKTPGLRVILEARNSRYLYTTSAKAYRYGGPIFIWAYSMLYTRPIPNEPNLNSDLFQCSLLGTNSVRLFSGVTDYYPQEKGGVIVKRRTSRSGHELLFVKAAGPLKAKLLHAAFDFGDAAINSAEDEWAAFIRPRLGLVWEIVVAPIGQDSANVQTLPLPDGVLPGRIAWSGEKLMILANKGERMVCYEISPKTGTPEWKPAAAYNFPGLRSFVLNKSESLEINQITVDGKPVVEVASVWFTGDRDVLAQINDFTLRGSDLLGGRYAFIWGEKNSVPAAYTVDIRTKEIIPGFSGAGQDIKPFLYPPHSNPLVLGK